MSTLHEHLATLSPVSEAAARIYSENKQELLDAINKTTHGIAEITTLIGRNPLQMMYDNHRNHIELMANVMLFGEYTLLAEHLPWVYRAYHSQGFSFDYFPVQFQAWISAVNTLLPRPIAEEIRAIYHWMLEVHTTSIELSLAPEPTNTVVPEAWQEYKQRFLKSLLDGNNHLCLSIAQEALIANHNDLLALYRHLIQPAMTDIGLLWENGKINVAQEHLASTMVIRILTLIQFDLSPPKPHRGLALVTAAPNEFHEIGASMVANALEQDGWDVCYLGANTPAADLLKLLHENPTQLLCISVAMAFNLERLKTLITTIHADTRLKQLKIMIGGHAFAALPQLAKQFQVDGLANDCSQAVQLARSWSTDLA